MKHNRPNLSTRTHFIASLSVVATLLATNQVLATDLATAPLQTSTSTMVKPNIMFILDDSGSMDSDYLPDWADSSNAALFKNAGYNGVYYDPAIRYSPPLDYKGDSWTSITSNWTSVRDDAYRIQSTSSSDLTTGTKKAQYYTFIPGEFCTAKNLRTCVAQSAKSAAYPEPAILRWCNDTALTDCQASRIEANSTGGKTYLKARYPGYSSGTNKVTLTVSQAGKNSQLSSLLVDGQQIMGSTASISASSTSNMANAIAASINQCTNAVAGTCTIAGYSASVNNSRVTITAPVSLNGVTLATTLGSTGATISVGSFSGNGIYVPGSNVLTEIVSTQTSYTYPGSTTKASARDDCAGTTCTYNEEMTNYANWWTYYRTRMQMMKTAASQAFSVLGTDFRLGYISINNSAGSDFLNVADITTTTTGQKKLWYDKLVAANPASTTPLRGTLSKVGRYYAGKFSGSKINGVTATDPMQYACQRNYTILSTDGYWNESGTPTRIDGTTAIGDQDSASTIARPYLDGQAQSNTLADVAYYYYNTDIRSSTFSNTNNSQGLDVSSNNVADGQQRMYTSTLGLGASGYMLYQSNYATATSGDYYNVLKGTATSTSTAAAGTCAWQTSGACSWPIPVNNTQPNIDDLWHAAVNGRGSYYSAGNPAALKSGLNNFLNSVTAATGNAAAATTSNPNTTTGDNYLFQSTFRSVDWTGELARFQINLTTGAQMPDADWSQSGTVYTDAANRTPATPLLDRRDYTTRSIYTYDPSNASGSLVSFDWANLSTSMQNMFKVAAIDGLSQMCVSGATCLDAAAKVDSTTAGTTTGAGGINLVNYLRGDRSNEGTDATTYYRQRAHVLGDIVDSQAVYVKTPMYNYTDTGYATYKTDQASRQGAVYVGANDGMLHAFNADNGAELWGYIPSMVLPNLYKLADKNYGTTHSHYVNATPQQADVYFDSAWHTILVGGLGRGGRGFYALDVTDPSSPSVLWEFTSDTSKGAGYVKDADLGYSYGTPVITKLSDGTWAVIVTSGYNNNEVSGATGKGFVWILNAKTGAVIKKIDTDVGTTSAPAGLARIIGYSETASTNNTATSLYGGDLLGNVWRIDISAVVGSGSGGTATVQRIATLKNASGDVQPITSRPQVSKVGNKRVIFVGTGQYLGLSDIATTGAQSIYALKDTNTSYGNPRASTCSASTKTSCFVKQVYADSNNVRTATSSVSYDVDFETMNGWFTDLPTSGERANTDPALQLGTLVFTTNIPSSASACSPGGTSNIIYVNYKTGLTVPGASDIGGQLSSGGISAMASAPTLVRLPNGKVVAIINLSNGTTITKEIPVSATNQGTRRLSWRELITGQ